MLPLPVEAPRLVSGLSYLRGFIAPDRESALLALVDQRPWQADLQRRVQHYGYRYDYTRRSIDETLRAEPMPPWGAELATELVDRGLTPDRPDQLIVNEYQPGQGITPHVDCVPCFAGTVMSLSLGSACTLDLARAATREHVPLYLEPGSLVVFSGDARYEWTHGIAGRKSDVVAGRRLPRGRRVSLTFRTVVLADC
jgi:alkylated DNA repair dioxygenase AlkB